MVSHGKITYWIEQHMVHTDQMWEMKAEHLELCLSSNTASSRSKEQTIKKKKKKDFLLSEKKYEAAY